MLMGVLSKKKIQCNTISTKLVKKIALHCIVFEKKIDKKFVKNKFNEKICQKN